MAAVKIADLGNGTGKIYEVTAGGVIKNHWKNTAAIVKKLKGGRALENRIIYPQAVGTTGTYTEDFHDPAGDHYMLDSNAGATTTAVGGDAIDVTAYIIIATKNPVLDATIASGVLTIQRLGTVTKVNILPEAPGTADDLDFIKGPNFNTTERDFQEGDIVILCVENTAHTITCKHAVAGDGHLRMAGLMHYAVKGSTLTAHVAFIKRGQGLPGWEEIFRAGVFVQTKKITVTGLAQNIDPNTDATNKIANQDGVYFLDATGVTQTGAFVLNTAAALPGQKYKVIPVGNWTGVTLPGGTITIFGKAIPKTIAMKGNWSVEAWYDENNAVWRAVLNGTSQITYDYRSAPALEASYTNQSLIGLAVGDFIYLIGGMALNFSGSRANATFDTVTGTITYVGFTPDVAVDAQLIILKLP